MFLIYKISNNVNEKLYIGQTIYTLKRRFYEHTLKSSGCVKLLSAIQKYGKDNFKIELLTVAHTQEIADYWEVYFINRYKTLDRKFGYNLREGGSRGKFNNKGRKHTPEELRKMSESQKGRIIPEEVKKKMSNAKLNIIPWNSGKGIKKNPDIPNPKILPKEDMQKIKNDFRSAKIIAEEYGVSKSTILNIRKYFNG